MSERKWLGKVEKDPDNREFVAFNDANEDRIVLRQLHAGEMDPGDPEQGESFSYLSIEFAGSWDQYEDRYLRSDQIPALIRHLQTWLDTGRLR